MPLVNIFVHVLVGIDGLASTPGVRMLDVACRESESESESEGEGEGE